MESSDDDSRVPPPGEDPDLEPATRVEQQLDPEPEPIPAEPGHDEPELAEDAPDGPAEERREEPPRPEGPATPRRRAEDAFRREPQTRRAAGERPGRRRQPRPPGARRDLLGRRLVAFGVAAIVLILIVVAFRGCLDARKQRSFENYSRDVEGIVAQSKQLSTDFFRQIGEPEANTTELSFEAQVASDRGTAENLADRVQNLHTPDELAAAQNDLLLAFELRRDALADISDQLKTALGGSGKAATDANAQIAKDMRSFLASDVIYDRARTDMLAKFADEGLDTVNGKPIADVIPPDEFLPDLNGAVNWIDPLDVQTAIAAVAGGTGAASSGTHGVALLQSTLQPGGVILTPDTPTTFSGGGSASLEVQVQNQGDVDEKGVTVSVSGAGSDTATIPSIKAGATETATLSLDAPSGETASITVTVSPVSGEQLTDNNESTYQVTFG